MNALVMIPNKAGFAFTDLDLVGPLQRIWGNVHELDPDALYRERGMSGLESEVLRVVEEQSIDVLLNWTGGYDFRPQFLHQSLAHVYRVFMTGDDEYGFDMADRYYGQCFDLVLTHNPLHERYRQYGIDADMFPSVFSKERFFPDRAVAKDIDASFIGTALNKSGRDGAVRALEGAGIGVALHGPGSTAGPLDTQAVVQTYRRSRINLNFTGVGSYPLDSEQTIVRRIRQVKGRCTKIALCGSFVLSEYAPGIEKLFQPGEEIDVFEDEEELVAKARFYLANEARREEMAARAHARALQYYEESRYWERMAAAIEGRARDKAGRTGALPLLIDAPFWSGFGAWRFKYLVIFFFAGRLRLFFEELLLLLRAGRFNPRAAAWLAAAGLHIARQHSRSAAAVAMVARAVRLLLKGRR